MLMFPMLDEPQRLQYLQTLGITSWLPTDSLPGSKVNDVYWCEAAAQSTIQILEPILPVASALPLLTSQSAGLVNESVVQKDSATSALSILTQKADKPHIVSTLLKLDTKQRSDEIAPVAVKSKLTMRADRLAPLHLGLSWYNNGVLVVNDIPVQEGAAMSSPIQRLQTAIVNAMGFEVEGASVEIMPAASMEFNWPLVPGPHADHSLVGAQSGLKYSLIKLIKDNQCNKILVMGPAAMKLLEPQMILGEISEIDLFGTGVQSVYSHSLHQLLAVPSLKKEAWSHLKSLIYTSSLA